MVVTIGVLATLGCALLVEAAFDGLLLVMQARHKRVASRWGHNVKQYHHMYRVFRPWFMARWDSDHRSKHCPAVAHG